MSQHGAAANNDAENQPDPRPAPFQATRMPRQTFDAPKDYVALLKDLTVRLFHDNLHQTLREAVMAHLRM